MAPSRVRAVCAHAIRPPPSALGLPAEDNIRRDLPDLRKGKLVTRDDAIDSGSGRDVKSHGRTMQPERSVLSPFPRRDDTVAGLTKIGYGDVGAVGVEVVGR